MLRSGARAPATNTDLAIAMWVILMLAVTMGLFMPHPVEGSRTASAQQATANG